VEQLSLDISQVRVAIRFDVSPLAVQGEHKFPERGDMDAGIGDRLVDFTLLAGTRPPSMTAWRSVFALGVKLICPGVADRLFVKLE